MSKSIPLLRPRSALTGVLACGLLMVTAGSTLAFATGTSIPAGDDGQGKKDVCTQKGNDVLKAYSFSINGKTAIHDLSGVRSGDTIKASFQLADYCTAKISLVSYTASSATFTRENAAEQKVFDSANGSWTGGEHSLEIKVPGCFFQVDLVLGDVIEKFGPPASDNYYSDQHRLIDADNGGSTECKPPCTPKPSPESTPTPKPTPTSTSTPETTPETTPEATPTPKPTVGPTPTPTPTPTPVVVTHVVTTPPLANVTGGVMATSTSVAATSVPTPGTGVEFPIIPAGSFIGLGITALFAARRRDAES